MARFNRQDQVPHTPNKTDLRAMVVGILESNRQMTGNDEVNYWINLFRPKSPMEQPFTKNTTVNGEDINVTIDPYYNRVKYLLTKFFTLDGQFQDTIRKARAENIFWEGDDRDSFYLIWGEFENMREMGVEQYRAQCLQKLRQL